MNLQKLVSVIVPCYNQALYLPETLDSVLEQTYLNWECIIVNDGSPDNTEEIAKQYCEKDKRFKYIYQKNGGLSSARNVGINNSKGEFIQFLDSDDLIESEKLNYQISYLIKNDFKIDVLISGYRYFENFDYKLRIFGRDNFLPEVALTSKDNCDLLELFDIKNPFVISAPIYKRCIFAKIGYFDEELHSFEDWDFNFRCALNGFIFQHSGYEMNTMTLIRLHDKSMMRNGNVLYENYMKFRSKIIINDLYIKVFGKEVVIELKHNHSNLKTKTLKTLKLITPPILITLVKKTIKIVYKND